VFGVFIAVGVPSIQQIGLGTAVAIALVSAFLVAYPNSRRVVHSALTEPRGRSRPVRTALRESSRPAKTSTKSS
jgi:hypothetical protein